MKARAPVPLLGAHVSTQGGVAAAPDRGRAIGATAIQIFTKTPNQWRDPVIDREIVDAFRERLAWSDIATVVAHDSYLINLASPEPALWEKSIASFTHELERCRALGIAWVVSHPGNFIDQRDAGIARNARGYATCLARVDGPGILIEGMAGAGTALGATFEELAALRAGLPAELQHRVGFCLDTAHLHAAGYNVAGDVAGVLREFDSRIGLDHLHCLHLNDSRTKSGSRLDRHAWIGEGMIGPEAFRRIMRDSAMEKVIKIIETPKGDDAVRHDRRMLRRLRAYARGARPVSVTQR